MPHSSDQAPGAVRPSTAVDAIAERYVARLAELSPEFAVYNGLPGRRGELDDYSPEGLAALSDLDRSTLRELDGVEAADDVDRVTVAAMRERLGVGLDLADAGEDLRSLNNIDSPVQTLRDGFDNLPTATGEDWADFASALRAVPRALDQYAQSLRLALARGDVAAHRQVRAAIFQARDQAADGADRHRDAPPLVVEPQGLLDLGISGQDRRPRHPVQPEQHDDAPPGPPGVSTHLQDYVIVKDFVAYPVQNPSRPRRDLSPNES
mgnify:CR=1 FL=1